ncbi:MAG: S1C family serine protease [Actinomycetales bacterium]
MAAASQGDYAAAHPSTGYPAPSARLAPPDQAVVPGAGYGYPPEVGYPANPGLAAPPPAATYPTHPTVNPGDHLTGYQPRPRSRRRLVSYSAALAGCCLALGLVGGFAGSRIEDRLTRRPVEIPIASGTTVRDPDSVAGVAAKALPSTVSIEVSASQGQGSGSGFVLDSDGRILTNNHVVEWAADSGQIRVIFSDGSESAATIVGRTVDYDLAVLKVDRTGLTPLPLGDSDAVVVGDPVIAVGAPLGLQSTVTTGIVSALHRPVVAGDSPSNSAFISAIQTDAAINPGNSGGPLLNGRGEVIGINSAIARLPEAADSSSGNIGLGFAIPSNQAARTATELIETGKATYPVIGVVLDSTYSGQGVRVAPQADDGGPAVTPDGPAAQAGIAPGDIITGFQGRPVTEPDELIVGIRAQQPGDSVTLTVEHDGVEREVQLELSQSESN